MSDPKRYMIDFEAFTSPPRKNLTAEEIVAAALRTKVAEPRSASVTILKSLDTVDLVRYKLLSQGLYNDYDAMGVDGQLWRDADVRMEVARFGLLDRETGAPLVVFTAYLSDDYPAGDPYLAFAEFSNKIDLSSEVLVGALNELGISPGHNTGLDAQLANTHDVWFREGVWVKQEPVFLIKVTYERASYFTSPGMRETVDVLLPEESDYPLHGDGDRDRADDNAYRYKMIGMDQMEALGSSVRFGFSSWFGGNCERVKVVDLKLLVQLEQELTVQAPGM